MCHAFADPALQNTASRTQHKEGQTCRAISNSWKTVSDLKELIALWLSVGAYYILPGGSQ